MRAHFEFSIIVALTIAGRSTACRGKPPPMAVMFCPFGSVQFMLLYSLHWLILSTSLLYLNHERYSNHLKYHGTEAGFRKKPPNTRRIIVMGAPIEAAEWKSFKMVESAYPKPIAT